MEEAAGPGKRKNLMDNIKSRVNSGAYNMTRYRKNEKNLRNKVKFFEKKEAAGELKGYMRSRLDAARALLAQLQAMKSGEAPAVPVEAPAPRAPSPVEAREFIPQYLPDNLGPAPRYLNVGANAGPAVVPLNTVKPKARARTMKKPVNNNAELNREIAKMNRQIAKEEAERKRAQEKAERNQKRANERAEKERQKAERAATKKVRIANAPLKTRRRKSPNIIENEYFEQAMQEYLPLPEMWNPLTGVKFEPSENPMPPIEEAYHTLRKIKRNFLARADELRAAGAAAKGSVNR
jgi:hypothetical protein